MGNFIATLILIGITLFILNLFPFFQDWTEGIRNDINEKKNNIVEEYIRVQGKVDEATSKIVDTKDKIDNTIDKIGEAVDAAGQAMDTVDGLINPEDESQAEEAEKDVPAEGTEEDTTLTD